MYGFLLSSHLEICYDPDCPEAVKQMDGVTQGAWFITMNHPGFNSPKNNRYGYSTERGARKAIEYYAQSRGTNV